jgi:hypothetical protein
MLRCPELPDSGGIDSAVDVLDEVDGKGFGIKSGARSISTKYPPSMCEMSCRAEMRESVEGVSLVVVPMGKDGVSGMEGEVGILQV